MFGYVVIDKPNILIKDYQTYRSYYCGLCKAIGKRTGQLMRFTLNYDIVFLALLGYNYENEDPVFKQGHCPIHPVRKIEYVENSPILEKIADVNTILGYYKTVDDVVDEGKHRVINAAVKGYYKKAEKRLPDFAEAVKKGYEEIREKEKNKETADRISDSFGNMLMRAGDAVTDKCDVSLRKMLFYVGKWIYVIDAFDDMKDDEKNHNFNPFLRENKPLDDTLYQKAENEARVLLYDCMENVKNAYNRMKIEVSEGPLSNVVYLGMKSRTENILKCKGEKCRKIRL